MSNLNAIFERLENLTKKDGQTEFVSVIKTNLLSQENHNNAVQEDIHSFQLLQGFLKKIFDAIDELSRFILNDDSILISVKNQKLLRSSFQIITYGISICLIPGLGISLTKRCLSSIILPPIELKDVEKYELLVQCTNFLTRSYEIPVLRNIITTLHLSDYLAVLIQLSFAPLKKPGSYKNFEMTQEMYNKLSVEREDFKFMFKHLVENCFQPTLMKELLVLQSVVNPSPPAFVKRVIAQELGQRLLAPGGLLSLIRCFIESYDIDTGFEWKKIDMICRIVSTKHGNIPDEDYLNNISCQLVKILNLNNTHYLTTALACVLSLNDKYPDAKPVKSMVKDIFQVFDYDSLLSKSELPGTIIISSLEIDHKVNILYACVSKNNLNWQVSMLKPNLPILFLIALKCMKSEELKIKIKDILIRCLEKLGSKEEILSFMTMVLFEVDDWRKSITIEEYESGITIKSSVKSQINETDSYDGKLPLLLDILKLSTNIDLVKTVFQISLDFLIELSIKRRAKANTELLILEDDPIIIDDLDKRYATILQLLSEISLFPKLITILKSDPSIVITFIEHYISRSSHYSDEECTTMALVLLNTILSSTTKDDNVEKICITLKPLLKKLSEDESGFNHILCKEALSLMSTGITQQTESACGQAIADVFDNLLPVRAHGIIALTKLIDAKDPETISKRHYIFCIFQEQLKDPDSYIYLSAINGLASLCTQCTEDVLHVLCNEFLQISMDQTSVKTDKGQDKIAEVQMKIADVIVKVIQRLGEMAVVHKTILLNTMLCGCRDDDPLIRTSALSNLAEIAQVLHYKIGPIIYEVLLCIWSIIETDKAIECRRAAVMVISSLLKGLGKENLIQLKENLLPIYRTLKSLYRDNNEDSIVRLHAQIALEELNDIVNLLLFPEIKMEKQIFI